MSLYDPKRVIVTVGTAQIIGFAPGTFVDAERNEDAIAVFIGTQGEYAWALNRNKSGVITLTLLHTSFSNDYLQSLATLDEQTGLGGVPSSIEDLNGRTLVKSPEVHVRKVPNATFSNEVVNREWGLIAGSLDINIGGNLT